MKRINTQQTIILIILVLFLLSSIAACDKLNSFFSKQPSRKLPAMDYFDKGVETTIWVDNHAPYKLIDDYKWITVLYKKKDFAALEKHIIERLNSNDDDKPIPLKNLYGILVRITDEKHILSMESVLSEWCRVSPNSHIAWFLRGNFYLHWAWFIRGDSVAKNVPKEAWPKFQEKLEFAKKDLEYSYRLNPNDANSSAALITVAKGLSLSRDILEQYFKNGITASPLHYMTHINKSDYLSPRWGGTKEEMMQFAKDCYALANQNPRLGFILVSAYKEDAKYGYSKNDNLPSQEELWQIMDKLFASYLQTHPDNIELRFSYAHWASNSKKYDVAINQFEAIGNLWMEDTTWANIDSYNDHRAYSYYFVGKKLIFEDKQYEPAIEYLQTALRYKKTASAYYCLGTAYWHKGCDTNDRKYFLEAKDMFKKTLELDSEYDPAKEMLKRLKNNNY